MGGGDWNDDIYRELLDDNFVDLAATREPSAEERRLAADAAAWVRQSELVRSENRSRRRRRARAASKGLVAIAVLAGVLTVIARTSQSSFADGVSVVVSGGASAAHPPAAVDEHRKPLGQAVKPASVSTAYTFLDSQRDSNEPITFDPCRPVKYVVNYAGAPPGAHDLVTEAVERVARATGLRWEQMDDTDEISGGARLPYQSSRYGKRWAPVLIGWNTPEHVAGLSGRVGGLGGPIVIESILGHRVAVSGTITLDGPDMLDVLAEPDGRARARTVIMHELGHVVGLDHTNDTTQVMFESGSAPEYGDGDLNGLYELGRGTCDRTL